MTAVSHLPQIVVRVNDAVVEDAQMRTLAQVRVEQRASLPAMCELTFLDPPKDAQPQDLLAPGSTITVGVAPFEEPLFDGDVTAVEVRHESDRGTTVHVRGYDVLHRLRKTNTARTFDSISVRGVVSKVVSALSLPVVCDGEGPTHSLIVQNDDSDLELMRRVTDEAGVYFVVAAAELVVFTLEGTGQPLPLRLGDSLMECRVELNADRAADSVAVSGWDPRTAAAHTARAKRPRSGRTATGQIAARDAGGHDDRSVYDRPTVDEDGAAAVAQALLDRRHARTLVLTGTAEGNQQIRPSARVDVDGIGSRFSGVHVVTSATHTIGESGFLTEFSTEPPPGHRRSSRAPAVTVGTVVDIADPERLGRVRVTLPSVDNVTTEWLPVCLPGIGRTKGLVALPDVDDVVLVVFPSGDYAHGAVIGSLFGSSPPDDTGIDSATVQRYRLASPGGHLLVLDDAESSVVLEHESGSVLRLDDNGVRLTARGDLTLEAPGGAVTIAGDSVDFKRRP